MTINDVYEAFEFIDDWEERYTFIIELGRKLDPLNDVFKVDSNRVWGCTSRVWLVHETTDSHFKFIADSDALIVRGLIAILVLLYSNKTAAEILAIDAEATFERLGLENHLSPNRRSGFFSMVERMKTIAQEHAAQ